MDVARICCRGLVFVTSIFKTGRERTVRFFLVFLSSPRIKYFFTNNFVRFKNSTDHEI